MGQVINIHLHGISWQKGQTLISFGQTYFLCKCMTFLDRSEMGNSYKHWEACHTVNPLSSKILLSGLLLEGEESYNIKNLWWQLGFFSNFDSFFTGVVSKNICLLRWDSKPAKGSMHLCEIGLACLLLFLYGRWSNFPKVCRSQGLLGPCFS